MEIEDEASKIAAQLDNWQSPRLGRMRSYRNRPSYEGNEGDAWLRETTTVQQETPLEIPEGSRLITRMGTPMAVDRSMETDAAPMEDFPRGVASPGTPSPMKTSPIKATPIINRSNPSSKSSHNDYQRYYDACLKYITNRKRVSERMDLQNEKFALFSETTMVVADDNTKQTGIPGDEKLSRDEQVVELEFLRELSASCWDRAHSAATASATNESRKEGDLWLLLHHMRELGAEYMIWNDDSSSRQLQNQSITLYVQNQSTVVECSDKELLDGFYTNESGCPSVLLRRHRILKWLEHCREELVPHGATRPRKVRYIENDRLLKEGLPETDKDPEILQCALALILAGRLKDVQTLARESGVPWRAAVWGGGAPDDGHATGNPRRFLWKKTMWDLAEKFEMQKSRGGNRDEAAIISLLCSHVTSTLENPSCRSWQLGLYAVLKGVLERTEDELLQRRNKNRRNLIPYFPVAENESIEVEHLKNTSALAGKDEIDAIFILTTAPFEDMKCNDKYTEAMASFVTGKQGITKFMSVAGESATDEASLRFLTHVALYLDSLAQSTNQVLLPGAEDWRNELVGRYVDFLASREDLWYMIVLYASLLPESFVFEELPCYLAAIESQPERETIVGQLRELLPVENWDTLVLKQSVALVLSEEDTSDDIDDVTQVDSRKMRSFLWLTFDDRHSGEALMVANTLLRQFLLAAKSKSALTFIEMVPLEVLQSVNQQIETIEGERVNHVEQEVGRARLKQAHSEFVAFQAYTDAITAFEQWRVVIESSDATASTSDSIDRSRLNSYEREIADRNAKQQLVAQKRVVSSNVVSAANDAQNALRAVLEHPGGFLLTEDEVMLGNDEEKERRTELEVLRVKLLPNIVALYQHVCAQTARWMSASLDHLALGLQQDCQEALKSLDDANSRESSPVSPKYWAKKAVDIVNTVASDKHKIGSVFGQVELCQYLENTRKLVVESMMY